MKRYSTDAYTSPQPGDGQIGRHVASVLRAAADYLEGCSDTASSDDINARRARFYRSLDRIGGDAEAIAGDIDRALKEAMRRRGEA